MRPGQRALQRIRLRTVTPAAGAEHRRDDAAAEVDSSNDVVFGVGHVDAAGWRRPALWDRPAPPDRPGRRHRSSPVDPCPRRDECDRCRDRCGRWRFPREARETGDHPRRRRCVRGPFNGVPLTACTVRRRLPFARAAERLDPPGRQIDAPNPVIADVADQQVPFRIDGDAVRLAQLRARSPAPPSPENPATPVPANVEMIPVRPSTFRITWLSRSAMYR